MNTEDLIYEINRTKKYSSLYPPLINRVCTEEFVKYKKDKEKVKAVKNRLHIIYGAFFYKPVKNIILKTNEKNETSGAGETDKTDKTEILKLHASTNERLPSINKLYKFISDNINNIIDVEKINSVLDIGCGLNPFFLPLLRSYMRGLKYYHALDIDLELARMLNEYFEISGFPPLAGCIDVISENPAQQTDIAFLFKLIPTIENCKKGRGFELISHIDAKYIIVTFPVKTLCGKEKGMAENYASAFEKNINSNFISTFTILAKDIIGTELVYILAKK